jgi:membrane-associated phospholipid phosphatase
VTAAAAVRRDGTAAAVSAGVNAMAKVSGRAAIFRRVVVAAGLLFLLLMGLARFYLGDHWFSDVAGAYVLGGIWIGFETLAYGQVRKRWPDKLRPLVARA